VRATINSADSVLPPKTYRNKYAVRPVRGWAAALYSNAVHMEQFITLQHWREKERKREKKREKEPVAFFYADARHVRASLYPSTIVPTIVELLFRNLRFAYLATTVLVHTRPHVHGAVLS